MGRRRAPACWRRRPRASFRARSVTVASSRASARRDALEFIEMLLSIDRLLRRRAEPESRAAELDTLRARFRAQPSAREAGSAAVESAKRLRDLRVAMSASFENVEACGSCAKGRPEPNGHWVGGSCCGSRTLDLFTPHEVAALKLAGVRFEDLHAPRGDHAGCAFRGESGCSLDAAQRPSVCVRYLCLELRAEVKAKPEWRRISELGAALRDEASRFEARQSRSPGP